MGVVLLRDEHLTKLFIEGTMSHSRLRGHEETCWKAGGAVDAS